MNKTHLPRASAPMSPDLEDTLPQKAFTTALSFPERLMSAFSSSYF